MMPYSGHAVATTGKNHFRDLQHGVVGSSKAPIRRKARNSSVSKVTGYYSPKRRQFR